VKGVLRVGTPVRDIVIGSDCSLWYPTDETPKYVFCYIWDVQKGDLPGSREPPNLHIFRMQQKDLLPCQWLYSNETFGWELEFILYVNRCTFSLADPNPPRPVYFVDEQFVSPAPEYQLFVNDFQSPASSFGYGGYATIFWVSSILHFTECFGLELSTDLFFEKFPFNSTHQIVKLTSIISRANILIKFPMP
jgi:hypothetical protein